MVKTVKRTNTALHIINCMNITSYIAAAIAHIKSRLIKTKRDFAIVAHFDSLM